MPGKTTTDAQLLKAVNELRAAVKDLPNHLDDLYNPRKRLVMFFLRGVLYGVGFLMAFAVVIPVIIWFLQSVEWVPLLGEIMGEIALRIDAVRSGLAP